MRKLNVLAWMDSPSSITGFGVVAKNILGRLYKTGTYNISCIGINYFEEHIDRAFEDRVQAGYPYTLLIGQDLTAGPGGSIIPRDKMGRGKAIGMIKNGGVDIFFGMRDLWDMVYQQAEGTPHLSSYFPLHFQIAKESGRNFRFVGHFPLEYELQQAWHPALDIMDYGYCFTAGGISQLKNWSNKISWCPQGADMKTFYKIDNFDKNAFLKNEMRVPENSFVVLNVNRNQPRKDIEATIASFAKFKELVGYTEVPVILWLHMKPDDSFGDARHLVQKYGLQVDRDVFFPPYFHVGSGWDASKLNQLYNAADVFISTSVAEGFSLTPVESIAAGCPVLVPGHTGFLQTVGRAGMPYVKTRPQEMRQQIAPSPISPTDIDDMAKHLFDHFKDQSVLRNRIQNNYQRFRNEFDWDNIFSKYWEPMFEAAAKDIHDTNLAMKGELPEDHPLQDNQKRLLFVCEEAAGDIIGASKAINSLKKQNPNLPIDFMCKNRFRGIQDNNPDIDRHLDWDINNIFRYPMRRVIYPHAAIRSGSWSTGPFHLLDMQSQMAGVVPGKAYINKKPFDVLTDDLNGKKPPLITINTTSQGGKMISPEKWHGIITGVLNNFPDVRFAVVGGKNDMLVPYALDMRGLEWAEQAWLQSQSFCHIGVDSSPGHCASTVRQPSVIFWGWTNAAVCKPQHGAINISAHYPTVCPRLGPCHGVNNGGPWCGIDQYKAESAMRAPCVQSLDIRPAIEIVCTALSKGLVDGRKWMWDLAEKQDIIYSIPAIQR